VPNRLQRGFGVASRAFCLATSLKSGLLVPSYIHKFPLSGGYAVGLASAARKALSRMFGSKKYTATYRRARLIVCTRVSR
jgi:hypothetical protein